ncbi:MAG TPA: hypothetical protein VHP33_10470 [Polyangiaceae bacterium]|nr:hypothetical protein [Polyangiaceae bacterium]
MSAQSHDHEDPLESSPVMSSDAITPRGGFMARPGLKTPPRHAVVVRGGEAPESDDIPRLRSSLPPPPPSEPVAPSNADKATLRAIPTPTPPRVTGGSPASDSLAPSPPVVESLPPPSQGPLSDAPLVASLPPPPPQRANNSRWTIVAAAAAGLVLGLASVAAKVQSQGVAAQPPSGVSLPAAPSVAHAPAVAPSAQVRAIAKTPAPAPVVSAERAASEAKASRPAPPSAKRSIF